MPSRKWPTWLPTPEVGSSPPRDGSPQVWPGRGTGGECPPVGWVGFEQQHHHPWRHVQPVRTLRWSIPWEAGLERWGAAEAGERVWWAPRQHLLVGLVCLRGDSGWRSLAPWSPTPISAPPRMHPDMGLCRTPGAPCPLHPPGRCPGGGLGCARGFWGRGIRWREMQEPTLNCFGDKP